MVAHGPESILNLPTQAPKSRYLLLTIPPANLRKLASRKTSAATGVSDRFDFDYRLSAVDVIGRRLAGAIRCRTWNNADSLQPPCDKAILRRVNNHLRYDAAGNITRRWEGSRGNPSIQVMMMLPKSNRLQKDDPQLPFSVNHYYDINGADTLNKPMVVNAGSASTYRWMYYDRLGRMAGYKQGNRDSGETSTSYLFRPSACRYDADGQLYLPCDNGAPQLSFDGPNVIGANTG